MIQTRLTYQNQTVKGKAFIQPMLRKPGLAELYEQEADRIADQVVKGSLLHDNAEIIGTHLIQRTCTDCEEEELQMKSLSETISPVPQTKSDYSGHTNSDSLTEFIISAQGDGAQMDTSIEGFMETKFGSDFSNVKIHTGDRATQLNRQLKARAFTFGSDIYFNEGQYQPNTQWGKHLLAHELAHTIQQEGSSVIQRQPANDEKEDIGLDLAVKEDRSFDSFRGDRYLVKRIGKPARIGASTYKENVTTNFLLYKKTEEVEKSNYDVVKTTGKKIYSAPDSNQVKFKLKFNELVQYVGYTRNEWAFISSPKGEGWVPKKYVYQAPDLASELHFVQSGDYLKNVIVQHYSGQGVNLRKWGADVRFYVHAVALVNQGMKGIGYYNNKKDLSLFREMMLDKTGEESQKIWNSAYLKKNHNIWMPSPALINKMKSEGVLSAGSVSYTAAEFLEKYFLFNIGIQIGFYEGLWTAFVETLQGIVDLVKLIGTLLKKIITGELIDYLLEIYESIKEAIYTLPGTVQQAWEEFMNMSAFDKGRAVGKMIGMILFEVLLAYFTAGAVTAIKWSGKGGRIVNAVKKLPDIRNKKERIKSEVSPPDPDTRANIEAYTKKKAEDQGAKRAEDLDLDIETPEAKQSVVKSLSRGAQQARNLGWPDPPGEGYFWVYRKSGKPYLSRTSKVEKKYFDESSMTFKDGERPVASTAHLPDVSKNYSFTTSTLFNGTTVKTAKGKLGVPGEVRKHRSKSSQRNLSGGTGDDAGHLIGDRFGAPGTEKNLSRQNWKANQGGGTFHDLENTWDTLLQEGWEIEVKVSDLTKKGSDRPFTRKVEWTGKGPNGESIKVDNVEYVNFETVKSREARGYVSEDRGGDIVIGPWKSSGI